MEYVRAHLFIEGMVQGVFYRAFTRNIANRLGVSGWVKNLYDGRVEAVLEGNRELVDRIIQECRKGPPGSHVSKIDVSWENFTGGLQGFDIRY